MLLSLVRLPTDGASSHWPSSRAGRRCEPVMGPRWPSWPPGVVFEGCQTLWLSQAVPELLLPWGHW